jgi:hypothetical protein
MKRSVLIITLGLLALGTLFAQQEIYQRTLINVPKIEAAGFGNFVSGVDLDGDGNLEIYAVNNNINDSGPGELTPRIYKFEKNATTGAWDSVWSATSSVPAQNTWPSLSVADMDGDGRKEIVWGIVNNITATDSIPDRILVFEAVPGQEYLGKKVTGNSLPNAAFKITQTKGFNVRPFRSVVADFNKDGKQDIVFCERASGSAGTGKYMFGVVSVNTITNDDTSTTGVTWTLNASGFAATWRAGTAYDVAVLDSTIYLFQDGATNYVTPITYNKGVFTIRAVDSLKVPGGSWKSSQVVDIDANGQKEIVVAGYNTATVGNNAKVYVLQRVTDSTLSSTAIADFRPMIGASGRLYGGGSGDIGGDGKLDFVFGSRGTTPFGAIVRLAYKGGSITDSANYSKSIIDRGLVASTNDFRADEIGLANVDGKAGDEIIYGQGYATTGVPIVILSDGVKAVNVTFQANTAGVPDTMKTNSTVQIRGSSAMLTWDNLSVKMTNAGGDYWKYTGIFPAGVAFNYKFFTNAKATITGADNGWEADLAQGNRQLALGNNDTTIALQYVNAFDPNKPDQYTGSPFPRGKTDTVVAYLRVNMKSFETFDPLKHKVGVRGSFPASNWGVSMIMTPEKPHANGGQGNYSDADKFYNLAVYWKKSFLDTASAGAKNMSFKFILHNINAPNTEDWSLMVDNPDYQISFTMPNKDTTVYWKWYRGVAYVPPAGKDTITVKYRVDLSTATQQKGFKPGDTVIVKSGFDLTAGAIFIDTLKKIGATGSIYETANRVITGVAEGKTLNYQYYSIYNLTEIREIFYDFDYTGTDIKAERRKITVPAKNSTITIADTSVFVDKMNRRPTFQSKTKLARNVTVTFTCDLRPAYYQLLNKDSIYAIQSSFKTLGYSDRDSVYGWGVWINGPAVGGWGNTNGDWGLGLRENLNKKMYDDGTHGDVTKGDRIYSLAVNFYKDSANNTVGQVFKFGIYGGDNEGGKGGFGNNHVRNIDDAAATAVVAEDFGSVNPKFYKYWDYTKHTTGVERVGDVIPLVYDLSQNYPNPFNPSTTINYSIPMESRVTLKIYNMLGQEVATVVNETMKAGKYEASFNASKLASGAYIYRIQAGTFVSVKKMMLLK